MNPLTEALFVSDVTNELTKLDYDVNLRNKYIEERDRVIYQDGLIEGLDFPDGHDVTPYNWGPRVVLMGRGFQVYSTYNKEDDSITQDDNERQIIGLTNKKRKANADGRKRIVDSMIRDNGGMKLWYDGAVIGSSGGTTVIKEWFNKDEKKTNIIMLESVNNYRAGWSSDNFRERDFDAYVWQVSLNNAQRTWGSKLGEGEAFDLSQAGSPLRSAPLGNNKTDDPLDQNQKSTVPLQTERAMVTVIDITGYIPSWGSENGSVKKVEAGKENRMCVYIVGGKVVEVADEESLLPDYYVVPNIQIPRRAWGESDLSNSAIEVNKTYIERMSDWITMFNKELFTKYLAKGYEPGTMPKWKQRRISITPAGLEQSIEPVQSGLGSSYNMKEVIAELKEEYVRLTGVSRVMFDDPSVSANSNQALMTTLKGVIDIVEAKQKNWEAVIPQLFKRALEKAAKHMPEVRTLLEDDPGWYFKIEWPSVLRKEDATYQQIWLNLFNAGVISLDTYHEKIGIPDASEEIDRIRDNMGDPITAAVLGRQLPLIATTLISPPTPQGPQVKYNVQVAAKTDTDPLMNEAVVAEVMGASQYAQEPTATAQPAQAPNPQLTTDQNGGQTSSQPGSGATAVSPEGANAMVAQQNGA